MMDYSAIERLAKIALAMRSRAYKPKNVDEDLEGCVILDDRGVLHRGCSIHYDCDHLVIEASSVSIASMIASGSNSIQAICMTDATPSLDALMRIKEFSHQETVCFCVSKEDNKTHYIKINIDSRIEKLSKL